jgi:hypothetical protein
MKALKFNPCYPPEITFQMFFALIFTDRNFRSWATSFNFM